jgi:hypothetical protein
MLTDVVTAIKEELSLLLNPSAFTTDSLEGWLVLLICLVIVYKVTKNAMDFVGWLVGLLFIIQLCYWLGCTGFDEYIHFSAFFKYDILQAVAQIFVGTKICDVLLYIDSFIRFLSNMLYDFFASIDFNQIKAWFDDFLGRFGEIKL